MPSLRDGTPAQPIVFKAKNVQNGLLFCMGCPPVRVPGKYQHIGRLPGMMSWLNFWRSLQPITLVAHF